MRRQLADPDLRCVLTHQLPHRALGQRVLAHSAAREHAPEDRSFLYPCHIQPPINLLLHLVTCALRRAPDDLGPSHGIDIEQSLPLMPRRELPCMLLQLRVIRRGGQDVERLERLELRPV